MTGRKTIDQMTSDELDQLYDELAALRQVARGYCPACGRGGAAPTVEDWEWQKQRADQAVAALAELLARFHPHPITGNPDGFICHPLDPHEYDRWRAALKPQEQQ